MAEGGVPTLTEEPIPGEVPRWEIPGWREELGVVAGVTGRGPVDGADFDLGLRSEAGVGQVMERWRSFLRAEPGFGSAVLGHQVHGRTVRWYPEPGQGWTQVGGVDGHATASPGMLLLVTVADCVPVYVVDPNRRALALLHAGWRGVAAGMLEAGIEALSRHHGVVVENLIIHCGVAISGGCYEVGNEVFSALGLPEDPAGRGNVDLRSEVARRARALGVRRLTVSPRCTATESGHFFSHRGSGGRDGRQVAYLGMPAPGSVIPPI